MAIESRTIEDSDIAGLSYRIDIEPDYDGSPHDAECYTTLQIAAWERDEWSYVGVIITPLIAGMELDMCSDSLWGLEYGNFPLVDEHGTEQGRRRIGLDAFVDGYTKDGHPGYPVPDMISQVHGRLAERLGPVTDQLRHLREVLAAGR